MKIERIKIAELKAPDTNVRLHTEKQIKEFIRSLNQFGQTRPAVIDENNVVLIGNGMVAAMKQRGDTEIDIFRKTGLSENDKKKLMMADNKIYTLGVDDYDAIDKLMEELQGDFDIPGFDEEVLQSMVSTVEEVTEQIANYGTMDDSQIQSIKEKGESPALQQEVAPQSNVCDDDYREQEEPTGETTEYSQNTTENFVICPKCGEKICL